MNNAVGYARFHRAIFGHAALRDHAEEAAFGWLIARAAWKPTRVRFRDKPIHLKRGQLAVSQRDLARGFRWSLGTLQRFLNRLTTESMIDTAGESGVTIITICNYSLYQAAESATESPVDTPGVTQPSQSRVTEQEDKNKEDSSAPKGQNGKSKLPSDWKAPSVSELPPKAQGCARQWPPEIYEREAEGFALYWHGNGKLMKDWRATWAGRIIMRHWAVMQETRRPAGRQSSEPQKLYEHMREQGRASPKEPARRA